MSTIDFAVWSPSEAVFWNSWVAAGIVDADRNVLPEYANGFVISDQTSQGWTPTRATGQVDGEGNPILEAVPGWHANVRVYGDLAQEMMYGLAQTDADGNMLNVFDRTWATHIFTLTQQPADPVTGFPAGYRNADGVTYCDVRDLSSPSNVWV